MSDVPWTTAREHCDTILESLPVEFSEEAAAYARELAERYDGELNSTPATIAACAVYFAGKYHSELITQGQAGEPVNVAPTTISQNYVKIATAEGIKVKHRGTSGERYEDQDPSRLRRIVNRILGRFNASADDRIEHLDTVKRALEVGAHPAADFYTTEEIRLELIRMAREHHRRKIRSATIGAVVAAESGAILYLMLNFHAVLYPAFADVNVIPGRGAAFHHDLLLFTTAAGLIIGTLIAAYNLWTRDLDPDLDDTERALRRLTWRGGLYGREGSE